MKLFKKEILLFLFIYINLILIQQIFSQDSAAHKIKQDLILKAYEKKIMARDKRSSDASFLSFKGGYQYFIPDYDNSLKGSWVADASIGAVMNNNWILGVNLDYWKTTINDYHLEGSNIVSEREYKGEGGSLFLKYRISVPGNKYNLELGAGIGPYRISHRDVNENFEGHGYLNLNARLGFNIKILDFEIGAKNLDFCINSEVAYYSLITFAKGRNPSRMLNFKLGPTINLFY